MDYAIETRGLTKAFPGKLAADHVELHVRRGDIYGFIGKNGAGKTTTMKLILGLSYPTEGEIELFGSRDLARGRAKIGSLIEAPGLYKNATAFENMKRFSLICGGTDRQIREILELVGLGNVGRRKAGNFSLGMRQRLGIAIALLGEPEVLILDEPINGLDPAGIKEIRDTIVRLNRERGVTFLISSHLLDELAKITTVYGIINDGRLVEEIDARTLAERCRQNLKLSVSDPERAAAILRANGLLDRYDSDRGSLTLFDHCDRAGRINTLLVQGGVEVTEMTAASSGFEEYFIERIGR